MTYQPGIPQPNDIVKDSQSDLKDNFTQLNTIFGVDHVEFDSGADNGKHNTVTFPEQASTPGSLNDEVVLFSQESASRAELFMRDEGGTAGEDDKIVQLTKRGELFLGAKPAAAINFNGSGVQQGNAYNATVARTGVGQYTITFTDSIKDEDGNDTNNYAWSASAMLSAGNFVSVTPAPSANYSDSVTANDLKIEVRRDGITNVDALRICVVVTKVQ